MRVGVASNLESETAWVDQTTIACFAGGHVAGDLC